MVGAIPLAIPSQEPSCVATATACAQSPTPSSCKIALICWLIVLVEMSSRRAGPHAHLPRRRELARAVLMAQAIHPAREVRTIPIGAPRLAVATVHLRRPWERCRSRGRRRSRLQYAQHVPIGISILTRPESGVLRRKCRAASPAALSVPYHGSLEVKARMIRVVSATTFGLQGRKRHLLTTIAR